MKKKKINYFKEVQVRLQELNTKYPNYSICMHLSNALEGYANMWGLSDKELSFALEKYQVEMEINNFVPDKDIDKIIEEGKNIDKIKLFDDSEDDLYASI